MFGRKKKTAQDAAPDVPADAGDTAEDATAARRREPRGPLDVAQIDDRDGYVDLGSVLVRSRAGLGVRLEVDERTRRPRAVSLGLGGGSVQVQAFAAPRSQGLWDEVRRELVQSLRTTGQGEPTVEEGPFGLQVLSRFPVTAPDGTRGVRVVRVAGVDGPRWFVRAAFTGAAATAGEPAAALEAVLRELVVVRGDGPMAPREPLPLTVPEGAVRAPGPPAEAVSPPRRGPEITEIG